MASRYPAEMSAETRPVPMPGQSRKRTSQACVPCGRRKTKCNGATPTCWQCQTSGRECSYGFSKRNKRQKCNDALEPIEDVEASPKQPHLENVVPRPLTPLSHDPFRNVASSRSQAPSSNTQPILGSLTASSTFVPRDGGGFSSTDGIVNAATSKRLLHAYFSSVHPAWPILYKPLYDCVDYEAMSGMLPRPVMYAMFAVAASLPVDAAASQAETPSPTFFFEQALQTMQSPTDRQRTSSHENFSLFRLMRPSLEHCQALALLALQQHGCAEPSRAYMLMSMAIVMATEIRLDRVSVDTKDAILTQAKSRIWWNLFVLEKMIASELSRPLMLRLEDAGTPLPSVNESDEYQLLQFASPKSGASVSTKAYTISGFHLTIQMATIMEKLYQQIYSFTNRENIRKNPQAGETSRLSLWQEIQDFQGLLAQSKGGQGVDILSSSAIPPSFLRNTLWTHTITIILHRPFWFKWHDRNPDWQRPADMSDPLELSFAAAEAICQIVGAHVNNLHRFLCDLIFPILTAASTLSHYRHAYPSDAQDENISRRLAMCLNWLSILGRNWKHAVKTGEQLSKDLQIMQNPTPQSTHAPLDSAPLDAPAYNVISNQPDFPPTQFPAPEAPRRDDIQDLEDLSSWNDRDFLNMLGDVEDDFCATNSEFRDFLMLYSCNEFG